MRRLTLSERAPPLLLPRGRGSSFEKPAILNTTSDRAGEPKCFSCRFLRASLVAFSARSALAVALLAPGAARADAVDDTLAKFLDDKFPQTEEAIGELAAEAPPQAAAILEALGDNRLMIDPADHIVAYKTAAGALLNAKTGEAIPDSKRRRLQEGAGQQCAEKRDPGRDGSLTLASPDPEKRLKAADDVFNTRDAKALPALQAQLAKESDPRVAAALKLAQAAILATSDSASTQDRLAAIATLKERGDQDAQGLIDASPRRRPIRR